MAAEVSLLEMLDARERRVHHQQELLAQYQKPLVCFTMNIAGPVKDSPLIRRGFARGQQLLRQQFLLVMHPAFAPPGQAHAAAHRRGLCAHRL